MSSSDVKKSKPTITTYDNLSTALKYIDDNRTIIRPYSKYPDTSIIPNVITSHIIVCTTCTTMINVEHYLSVNNNARIISCPCNGLKILLYKTLYEYVATDEKNIVFLDDSNNPIIKNIGDTKNIPIIRDYANVTGKDITIMNYGNIIGTIPAHRVSVTMKLTVNQYAKYNNCILPIKSPSLNNRSSLKSLAKTSKIITIIQYVNYLRDDGYENVFTVGTSSGCTYLINWS